MAAARLGRLGRASATRPSPTSATARSRRASNEFGSAASAASASLSAVCGCPSISCIQPFPGEPAGGGIERDRRRVVLVGHPDPVDVPAARRERRARQARAQQAVRGSTG
jgi:hypothetical protein